MLSLSPRYDLFRFNFPKDFLPKDIEEKYFTILNKSNNVIKSPIDYLNESIQAISIPGMSEINITQPQVSHNILTRQEQVNLSANHKINIRPKHDVLYTSSGNPLDMINKEFKVTFKMNQGLYNYFMLYEIAFQSIQNPFKSPANNVLLLELLDESGIVTTTINFYDVYIDSIDGLEFSFSKVERQTDTFDVTFKFNNIEFDFLKQQI